jgi:hypothetical protein
MHGTECAAAPAAAVGAIPHAGGRTSAILLVGSRTSFTFFSPCPSLPLRLPSPCHLLLLLLLLLLLPPAAAIDPRRRHIWTLIPSR